jgi:hypothetical protein
MLAHTTVSLRKEQQMRKLKIQHAPLPGIGELFELVATSVLAVTVVSQRSGRRDLAIGAPGADQPMATAALTRAEAWQRRTFASTGVG